MSCRYIGIALSREEQATTWQGPTISYSQATQRLKDSLLLYNENPSHIFVHTKRLNVFPSWYYGALS